MCTIILSLWLTRTVGENVGRGRGKPRQCDLDLPFRGRRAQCGVQGGDLIHNLLYASRALAVTDDLSLIVS